MPNAILVLNVAIAIAAIASTRNAASASTDGLVIRGEAQRDTGNLTLRAFQYEEQYGPAVPEIGDRRWRHILCVEVHEQGRAKPRRVWQAVWPGPSVGVAPLVISEARNGRCVLASSAWNTVSVNLIDLSATVKPLPDDELPQTTAAEKAFLIPEPLPDPANPDQKLLKSFGRDEIGMDLTPLHTISIESAVKIEDGWRIDAIVSTGFDAEKKEVVRKNILRFAIVLDEECKSAKFNVLK